MEKITDIAQMIRYIEKHYDNPRALNIKSEHGWHHISSKEFIYDVKRLTYGLIQLGVRRGDKVGILANPSPYWTIADLAIIVAGGITVPLFSNISIANFVYEIAKPNVRYLFVAGVEQWEMYEQHQHLFEKVIGFDQLTPEKGAIKYAELLKMGEELWSKEPDLFDQLLDKIQPEDLATIVYTSGSTGIPKGVMLSHKNLTHLISHREFPWDNAEDSYLSLLPLAHIFARQINIVMIGRGVPVYYLNELTAIPQTCQEIHPTSMIVVPRLLERMFSKMLAAVNKSEGMKKSLGKWAFELAGKPTSSLLRKLIFHPIADKLVYKTLRNALGGRFKVILCGGAALNKDLYQFYYNAGIPIYEGWGLTESSTTTVNRPGKVRIGTVGTPLPGSQVRVDENGELLVKGPTVMMGYYRDEASTKKSLDDEGWLHTGDSGEMDDEGFVKIFGRISGQFKLSTGEFVNPQQIEIGLTSNPLIDMAMIIGEKKPFAAALLFPDIEYLQKMKEDAEQTQLSDEEFLQSEIVQEEMKKILAKVNPTLNNWSRIEKYQFIPHPPTVEGGELTPSMQLKRKFILEKYHHLVDLIYPEEERI